MSDDLVSQPMDVAEARAKCEEAAATILKRHGGWMTWLDDKRLRVYKPNGDAFATLHIEALQ